MTGPTLRFHQRRRRSRSTAPTWSARLDGEPAPRWRAVRRARRVASCGLGPAPGPGARAYLAVRGGIDVPEYLGSRSTFILGKFGGHAGPRRCRRATCCDGSTRRRARACRRRRFPTSCVRATRNEWEIGVLYGPHGAPDFFTDGDIDTLFAASWKVHYNSDRTGVRLDRPAPGVGAEGRRRSRLHPSNLHDNAYAIGAMDFTGDMPILLGPDGPSLGGFVCPAVDRAGGAVEDRPAARRRHGSLSSDLATREATRMERELDDAVATLRGALPTPAASRTRARRAAAQRRHRRTAPPAIAICWSRSGPTSSTSTCAFRVHALEQRSARQALRGHRRHHARHPLAADPLRQPRAARARS